MSSKMAPSRGRRGLALGYAIVVMAAVIALVSLAIDFGRVQIAKTQLRIAADSAARAAAGTFDKGATAATNAAIGLAAANNADGATVTLTAADIEFGSWDSVTRTFTPLTGAAVNSANSIRVTARRTTERGNPIELTFGGLIGKKTCDVSAFAVATIASSGPGIVGLSFINISDKKTNSYKSIDAANPSSFSNHGNIYSNGDITLKSYVTINGDARPGIGKKVIKDGSCTVTGSTTPLNFILSFPMPTAGTYATVNNNAQLGSLLARNRDFKITSGKVTLSGSDYYVNNFSVSGPANVVFQNPVTLWVTGTVSLAGGITTAQNLPLNLKIRMVTSNTTASFQGNTAIYCDFYGPQTALTIGGNADYYGRIIAKSIAVSGSGELHFDESTSPTPQGLAIVK